MTKLDIEKIYINHFLDFLKQENIYNDFLNVIYKNTHFKNYMSLKKLPLSLDTYINFIKSGLHTPFLSKFYLTYLLSNNGVLFTNYNSKHSMQVFWSPKYRKWCKFVNEMRIKKSKYYVEKN